MTNDKKITATQKNWYIFKMLQLSSDYLGDEFRIKEKYKLHPIVRADNLLQDLKNITKRKGLLDKVEYKEFLLDIGLLVNKFGLGTHWTSFFILYLFGGIKIFPDKMLKSIDLDESKRDKKILIEINQYTTLEDIKKEWKEIEEIKKQVWKNKIAEKIGMDTINSYVLFMKDLSLQGTKLENKKLSNKEIASRIWESCEEDMGDMESLKKLSVLEKRWANNLIKNRGKFYEKIFKLNYCDDN